MDEAGEIVYSSYNRHFSQIVEKTIELLHILKEEVIKGEECSLTMSGSAGMGMAERCRIPFVQEVYATKKAADKYNPNTDAIIELGGEDAKILFLKGNLEVRMNGSCAGGTGAFIDQMATLLKITPDEMNKLAANAEKSYTIASRCGVFAKSDIQPLLNQGAKKEDIAISIFYAVVNQTIAGLAQGRPIEGKVLYLGGPLTFLSQLRKCFDNALKLEGICPENSLYYVCMGAALSCMESCDLDDTIRRCQDYITAAGFNYVQPLFEDTESYEEFMARHDKDKVAKGDINTYKGGVYMGIDAGSTTCKIAVISSEGLLLDSFYTSNNGNPVPLVLSYLKDFYHKYPDLTILGSAVTGYGEDIIKNAFSVDMGLVETTAHFEAAKHFLPEVDFIIDIGGQDMKCFKIHNGTIDNIFLNEACSSGCGSFLQTFAEALGSNIADFAKCGLYADKPVDLGSRCTVFMNSSVKQAQKDGASTENISAGLSMSVVKNAIYKVIRPSSTEELGHNIVVQGGTFYNDAVLRAFEQEMNCHVIRPDIAGLMGAYGSALYVMHKGLNGSTMIGKEECGNFEHKVSVTNCGLCSNHCRLTINSFSGGRRFISGNRCERPVTRKDKENPLNMYAFKRDLISQYVPTPGKRGKIGIPLGLNIYELYPFWCAFFTDLGFEVVLSPFSNRKLYLKGQTSIPSDTVCFPAKLMHGHIETLIEDGIDTIFYPCMSYNIDNKLGDNHYNCPVVAYYPEVLKANMPHLKNIHYIYEYVDINKPRNFVRKMSEKLASHFPDITAKEIAAASKKAYKALDEYNRIVEEKGNEMIEEARKKGMPIIILAGRPYHIDPEISHGIDQLIAGYQVAVVTEDVIAHKIHEKVPVHVLNQWTYHSRLYAAAKYVTTQPDMNLVQLVSFGCGCDAITTDECREILEGDGKIYTQIKIDEITNLGAVKIRLRSLFAATGEEK
ncbi:MAG: 2-hydroxyacyl-CoA dehydratase [Erysipelotrichaceae bacterium]|nr:2-hydroxyacyl-CoA dehydratase [Erysipelotrichaceae bacterium]